MADQKAPGLVIPDETREKFPELIELILSSESMNDEERQYWINILPIMTPEQIQNLSEILENEKKQLAAIDEKYSDEIERIGEEQLVRKLEEERRHRRKTRTETEKHAKDDAEKRAEDLLKKIEEL